MTELRPYQNDVVADFEHTVVSRKKAAPSTIDALIYELRTHGIAQLLNPRCRCRLSDLSTEQTRDLLASLMRLRSRCPKVTDELILSLGDLL
jgi:hypothetical protein